MNITSRIAVLEQKVVKMSRLSISVQNLTSQVKLSIFAIGKIYFTLLGLLVILISHRPLEADIRPQILSHSWRDNWRVTNFEFYFTFSSTYRVRSWNYCPNESTNWRWEIRPQPISRSEWSRRLCQFSSLWMSCRSSRLEWLNWDAETRVTVWNSVQIGISRPMVGIFLFFCR